MYGNKGLVYSPRRVLTRIDVVIVETNPLRVRQLVDAISIEEHIWISGIATTKQEVRHCMEAASCHVVLIDSNLEGSQTTSNTMIKEIRHRFSEAACMLLIDHPGIDAILEAVRNGAEHVILLHHLNELGDAIRTAAAGRTYIDGDISAELIRELQLQSLTPTERKVFALREQGLKTAEIADRLVTSYYTVRNHVKSLNRKLRAKG
ncbi:DNA-binding response regulator [Xylanibacillus composti]|uniref:HTH luxR-type domain-containing protein n=1 Tax=Xylanibacillus composti TaxID=1572762 RepID=A0A8J4H1Y5_9BACL|nr:response regulator transcription factor [Xylanibacillus composti]MDT9726230.1 DNA-binding response regulator [Xylanibacillus composti]GIQ68080.1 hypothetical protein XYCOK13_09040 [Xylanibacillus composti]